MHVRIRFWKHFSDDDFFWVLCIFDALWSVAIRWFTQVRQIIRHPVVWTAMTGCFGFAFKNIFHWYGCHIICTRILFSVIRAFHHLRNGWSRQCCLFSGRVYTYKIVPLEDKMLAKFHKSYHYKLMFDDDFCWIFGCRWWYSLLGVQCSVGGFHDPSTTAVSETPWTDCCQRSALRSYSTSFTSYWQPPKPPGLYASLSALCCEPIPWPCHPTPHTSRRRWTKPPVSWSDKRSS